MYSYELRVDLEKKLKQLAKKNPNKLLVIEKKINEIIVNPSHYKNLRKPLQYLKRVHIDRSFVLVFRVIVNEKKIIFEDFDHHDKIYKNK